MNYVKKLEIEPRNIKLLIPDFPSAEELAPWIQKISENSWYTNFGPLSRELEEKIPNFILASSDLHVTTVSSGTTGLELALAALELPEKSKVLVPSLSFPASATAIVRAGLEPVFCDICPTTWVATPSIAREALKIADLKAVMPVALFGRPLDAEAWDKFTYDTGIPVVIDAASAFGNQIIGKTTSAVFSFHATKHLAVGEGGAITACDRAFINRARSLANFGFEGGVINRIGSNGKMSELHAAVGLAALTRWPLRARQRIRLACKYYEALGDLSSRIQPADYDGHWVQSVLAVRIINGVDDDMIHILEESGIETRRWYWPPLHQHPAFCQFKQVSRLSATTLLSNQLLGLPFHLEMDTQDVHYVCRVLGELTR